MWEMIGTSTTAGTTGYPPKETIFNPYHTNLKWVEELKLKQKL